MPTNLCDDCNATGLPILPLRYAPVPATVKPALPGWAGGRRVTDIALGSDHHYALRTLRAGYVYLFYSKNQFGPNQWECYMVTGDGLLVKQPDARMAASAPWPALSCSRQGHSNARLRHLVIERPDKCGPTWIAFSEHKWSEQALQQYMQDSKLRNARMQTLHPAELAHGMKHSHGTLATAQALQEVLEYAPGFSAASLPHEAGVGTFSKEDGSFEAARLTQQSTRYPWSLRQGQAQADIDAMQQRARKPDGTHHTPQLLALWDAIGIAHELNGFRNDAAGWVKLYGDERALQLSAGNILDGLRTALVDLAGDTQKQAQDQQLHNAGAWHEPAEAAQQRARAQQLPEPQRSQRLEVLDITDDWARRQVPITLGFQGRLNAANQLPEPQRGQEIARIKSEVDRFTTSRSRNYGANIAKARAEAWPKYQDRIDQPTRDKFNGFRAQFEARADDLIDRRTQTLIRWLEAPLLIDTLEDFHPNSIHDGLLFEDAVSAASLGIGSSASGTRKIDEWVKEAKASVKTNLLWRALALNQQEGIAALDAALKEAEQHHAAQTLSTAVTWTGYTAKVLKGLADTYKKAQGVFDANVKATSSAGSLAFGARISPVNMRGIDAYAITFGDRVFRHFALDKLGDYASEKILQHIFSIRAFVDPLDSERLVQAQAVAEKLGREQTLRRLQATRAFMKLDTPETRTAQTEALKAAWEKFKASGDSKVAQAIKDTRLALVVGLIEGVNFMKLMADCKRKGDTKSYVSLLASGMTITSALFDVAATAAKNLPATPSAGLPALGAESWTYQALKGWGGVLSGGASFIGGLVDFYDATKSREKGYSILTAAYVLKSGAGLTASCLTLAVTFTYAAPLVARLTGRAAMGAAIEAVGVRAAAIIGFRILGMAAGGWITVGTLGIQVIIWIVTPNALQEWVDHCAFGDKRQTGGYKTLKEQEDKLGQALLEMGLRQ